MRRVASAVVVAAVAAVAILALVDAVRPLRTEPAESLDEETAGRLAEVGFGGTLVYTDASCAIHALKLPELTPARAPRGLGAGCEISVSPNGRWAAPSRARWSPDSSRYATCQGSRVTVFDAAGGAAEQMHTGCAPAWRPDGTLTLVRDRAIRDSAGRVLVPTGEDAVRDQLWLAPDEVAVLLDAQPSVVAGFRDGRLAWQRPYFGRFEGLVASPGGDVLPEPPPRPFPFVTRSLRLAGPFAWAPDGRGVAIATGGSVFVADLPSGRQVRVPVTALDLAWR